MSFRNLVMTCPHSVRKSQCIATMHSQARYAGGTLNDGMVKDRGIFMLQTINIQGNLFNVFMTVVVVI